MPDLGKAYVQIVPSAEGIEGSISSLLGGEAESAGNKAGGRIASGIGKALEAGAAVVAAGATAIGKGVADAVNQYADYEQLVGGIETLFGDVANEAMENASRAYETAGLSANQYMETVTGFAAALKAGLGEDYAWQMANYADEAVIDMADNANKMGSSMESIQNAYAGFAKQNFTMLDNLKLGYGGTKEEMQRLMHDAEELEGYVEGSFDLNNFADVVEAIHIVQENMGIAGTTAKEASSTISGSLSSLQAAWTNLITGLGNGQVDLGPLVDSLVSGAETLIGNVMPVAEQAMAGIGTAVEKLAPIIAEKLPALAEQVLPPLLDAVQSLLDSLVTALPGLLSVLVDMAPEILTMIIQAIVGLAPQLVDLGMQLIVTLAQGLTQSLPSLIPAAVGAIVQIVQTLLDPGNLQQMLDAALQLILGLARGFLEALPQLISQLPAIITGVVDFLLDAIPQIIETGVELLTALVENMPVIIEAIVTALPELFDGLITGLLDHIDEIINAGVELLTALVENMPKIIMMIVEALPKLIDGLCDGLLSHLPEIIDAGVELFISIIEDLPAIITGICQHIPEIIQGILDAFSGIGEKMWEVGKNIVRGVWEGIQQMWSWLTEKFSSLWNGLVSGAKKVLGIQSPSTVFAGIGENLALGLGEGWDDGFGDVRRDIEGSLAFSDAQLALAGGPGSGAQSELVSMREDLLAMVQELRGMRIVMDTGETVGVLASPINGALGNQYMYRKRGVI